MKDCYTYILKCSDGSLYTGWTNCLERRLAAHNAGTGAKYTRGRTPVKLVYYETHTTKEDAMRREYEIKHYSRKEKEALIRQAGVKGVEMSAPFSSSPDKQE